MDRQKHLAHVQFWLVVDGLRNPLEEDITSSDSECESVSTTTTSIAPWTPTDRTDLAQIHDAYLSLPELHISDRSKAAVREFLAAGSKATQAQYVKARAAILRAQTGVFEEMQKKDFVDFRASGLFYKYLASDEAGASATAAATGTTDLHRSSSWTDTAPGTSSPTDATTTTAAMDDSLSSSRHSLDGARAELDDWDPDAALSGSRTSLDDRRGSANRTPEKGIVEAMEAALNDIIESRPTSDDALLTRDDTNSSPRSSIDLGLGPLPSSTKPAKPKTAAKPPSISSLGLVGGSTRDAVFADELFPDEDAPEYASDSGGEEDEEGVVHQAAPGDLGLAEAISALSFDIGKLGGQEAVVESLLRKAELTGNVVELRILRKSLASLQREVRRKELQRQMYIVQESDNGLFVSFCVFQLLLWRWVVLTVCRDAPRSASRAPWSATRTARSTRCVSLSPLTVLAHLQPFPLTALAHLQPFPLTVLAHLQPFHHSQSRLRGLYQKPALTIIDL
jgi:sorting nexin-25